MARLSRASAHTRLGKPLSLFEKVILVSTLMLLAEAAAGLWITSHSLEAHHYLIDTSFIVGATVLGLFVNLVLLRSSFRPLFGLLRAMRQVTAGETSARAVDIPNDSEIGELALAFNRMLDQLETSRRLQALLILQAQEEERRRLARELHDESSQDLTALLVHTEILHQTLQAMPESASLPDVRASLEMGLRTLTTLAQETLEDVRRLALQLRPAVLDDLGLEAALRWLAEDCQQRFHVAMDLHLDRLEQALREQADAALYETTLFRIVQECLTNAARHASAQHISVSLQRDRHSLCLCVSDDGRGFETTRPSSGLGISGMRERAALLGER
jgi:two-component system, NarL family, sensor histidine kinase UhpB